MAVSTRVENCTRKKIAASLMALGLGGLITPALAANIVVRACSDADIFNPPLILFGLRSSVADANDGDTIDMTALSGCTITLTDGEIPITVNDLTFIGPTSHALTIDAHEASRIFKHTGTGTLALSGFTVSDGYFLYSGAAEGGCIDSLGTVQLDDMTVENCYANSLNSKGGGIFSLGVTRLSNSLITGNTATSYGGLAPPPDGGGIYALGGFESIDSVISNNTVAVKSSGGKTAAGSGAAVFAEGNVYLRGTTVSGNTGSSGGAVNIGRAGNAAGFAIIVESTISSNTGLYALSIAAAPPITIANSTIYSNLTEKGVSILNLAASGYPYMWSNIVAKSGVAVVSSSNVKGGNNFMTGGTQGAPFLSEYLSTGCLWLGPLRNNGGPTPTRALMSRSVAIDKGDTQAGGQPLDQRGLPRVSGTSADIGAYEYQQNDVIFSTDFEACL